MSFGTIAWFGSFEPWSHDSDTQRFPSYRGHFSAVRSISTGHYCFLDQTLSPSNTPEVGDNHPANKRGDSALPLCGRYKNGLPLLGEIYETEDTKPRLLIKIIHFGQSGARGGGKFAAAAAAGRPAGGRRTIFPFPSSPAFFLFYKSYLTSTLSYIRRNITSAVTHVS